MSIELADRIVREYLSDDVGLDDGFRLVGDDGSVQGTEVIEGIIYNFLQCSRDSDALLQVYLGLGPLGGQLWEQEMRVLARIGEVGLPALPIIVNGGYCEADAKLREAGLTDGFGWIRTEAGAAQAPGDTGAAELAEYFHDHPAESLRQLWHLADAMALLHDSRISHRNFWPGSLQIVDTNAASQLRIARFEFSALLPSILRGRSDGEDGHDRLRKLYLAQGTRSLRYSPPERLDFLLGDDGRGELGGPPGDVFGLGMMGAEWLLGPTLFGENKITNLEGLKALLDSVRTTLNIDATIPRAFASLLRDMIHPSAGDRPLMAEVMQRFWGLYEGTVTSVEAKIGELPYILVFQPDYSDRTLLRWKEIENSATTPEGVEEVRELIATDVTQAKVVVSFDGAVPYVSEGNERDRRRATTVIFGTQFVWFCETFWRTRLGSKVFFDEAQVVKYVLRRDRARANLMELLASSPFARKLPMVDVLTDKLQQSVLDRKLSGRPSWDALLASAPEAKPVSEKVTKFLGALDFLLTYNKALLTSRTYAYTRSSAEGASEPVLRWDEQRDRDRTAHLPSLQSKLVSDDQIRPGFADFFDSAADDGSGRIDVEVHADRDGRKGDRIGTYPLKNVKGQDQIVLDGRRSGPIPDRGWVRLAADGASQSAWSRQWDARIELSQSPLLLSQLLGSRTIQGRKKSWEGRSTTLLGEGAGAVLEVLTHEGLFAVQGPPGTGKTEVTSEAVAAYLRNDPTARVLVSAQSHDALDNLALRILAKLEGDQHNQLLQRKWIPLRVVSKRGEGRVNEQMQPFILKNLSETYVDLLTKRLDARLDSGLIPVNLVGLVRQWRGEVATTVFEMSRRLARAANVVFATCGASTRDALLDELSPEAFDWVLVEEAAKAWPTELAMPLVRGRRWTLVGDQAQIGAYAKQHVHRFLDSCQGDQDPEIRAHFTRREEYLDAFDLFDSVFKRRAPAGGAIQLTEQYRMLAPIAQVVGRAFYPILDDADEGLPASSLVTMRSNGEHGLASPEWLAKQSLIWWDTEGVHRDREFWSNEYEAQLIAQLIRKMRPAPRMDGGPPRGGQKSLAVLTPYRAQVTCIQAAVPEAAAVVRTVDSFQGQEADIVIVSLVRDTRRSEVTPIRNIGHLIDPARVNVALSRARDLLVVVGRLDHFENSGVPEWVAVTQAVRQNGRVLVADGGDVGHVHG